MEGQFLLAVLRLAEDGGQLLLAGSVVKVGDVLVGVMGQVRRGHFCVVVLDHDPHLVLCPGEQDQTGRRRENEPPKKTWFEFRGKVAWKMRAKAR